MISHWTGFCSTWNFHVVPCINVIKQTLKDLLILRVDFGLCPHPGLGGEHAVYRQLWVHLGGRGGLCTVPASQLHPWPEQVSQLTTSVSKKQSNFFMQDWRFFLSVLFRTELLRLLLTCFSEAMYLPPSSDNSVLNPWVTFFCSTENR